MAAVASVRLFVYGSLKRDGLHHDELAGASFLGGACTASGYSLEPQPGGKYLELRFEPGGGGVVRGELFEVDESRLPALDAFEGEAYQREKIRLSAEHSVGFHDALAYLGRAR